MSLFDERYLPLFQKSGKSDKELESEIGLPRSIIYDWKNGRNKGYKKYADMIAKYFNVSTDYLLGNDTSNTKDPATDDEIKFALFNGSKGITDEMYKEVKAFAEFVKKREQEKKGEK